MLHIINKSPLDRPTLDTVAKIARTGAILFIEDGVYAAARGNAAEARVKELMGRFKVYVLTPDLDARGVGDRLIDGITGIDYAGFVDLVAEQPNCHSWL